MKRVLPKLRPHSGDAYPPKLDPDYKSLENGSTSEEVTPWSLGEGEVDPSPPPIMYNCDENRIGKCVIPPNWPQQLAEIQGPQNPHEYPQFGMFQKRESTIGIPYPSLSSSSPGGVVVKPPVGVSSASAGQN